MELSDLTARELARIDAICLEFESGLRQGREESIEEVVSSRGGDSSDLLRRELEAIRAELQASDGAETLFSPFGISGDGSDAATPALTPKPGEPPLGGVARQRPHNPVAADASQTGRSGRPTGNTRSGENTRSGKDERGVRDNRVASDPHGPLSPPGKVADGISVLRLPEKGDTLGPYQIGRVVGQGGMGAVYEAIDRRLDRLVAIKVLAAAGSRPRELAERFEREAKAVASLSHPNVIELFDVGVNGGIPYAVMEYLHGETLEQRLRREPMTPCEVRRIGVQVCEALAAAHAAGVIHRDLKPQNIMLLPRSGSDPGCDAHPIDPHPIRPDSSEDDPSGHDPSGHDPMVKLFDFGLSRAPRSGFAFSQSGSSGDAATDDSRTRSGVILGTPGYLSPEQARGEPVTHAADIFGLGCVLHEAFYGVRAFDGATPAERFAAVLRGEPTADAHRRATDPELADLIDACLQKDPASRPTSASELAARLRRPPAVDSGQSGSPHPAFRFSRRRLFEATAGAAAGVAAGGWWGWAYPTQIHGVHSIAVLTLIGERSAEETGVPIGPAGNRALLSGEMLSGMIVNELSSLDSLTVPKFVPRTASTPAEFRRIGRELEVDSLLTGTYRRIPRELDRPAQIAFDLQIISAATGKQIWGKRVSIDGGDDYLNQSQIAGTIADAVGCSLITSDACEDRPAGDAYSCLVKGRTYADPDSVDGLRRALSCFQHARQEDPALAASHAGIALTSITLAAQSPVSEATERIETARAAAEEALRLSNMSVDARLAKAMLQWQTLYQYDGALRELRELSMVANNHWQVHHQYGLLLLLLNRTPQALDALRLAKRLHPASALLKTDHWRAEWFAGDSARAVLEAEVLRDQAGAATPARGLLVDIHEQSANFELAAAQHPDFRWRSGDSLKAYFAERSRHLDQIPYGPFGPELNQLILDQRRAEFLGGTFARQDDPAAADTTAISDPSNVGSPDGDSVERRLARLRNAPLPMLPLLLAKHPALRSLSRLKSATEMLPSDATLQAAAAHGTI